MIDPAHEFIEVKNRRWCVRCSVFQQRKTGYQWKTPSACENDTPYAIAHPISGPWSSERYDLNGEVAR